MLLHCVLITLCAALSAAHQYTPDNYPNPQLDVEKCGRKGVESRICDPDAILSYAASNKCEELIKTIHDNEDVQSPCGGFQVAVALVDQIHPEYPSARTDRESASRHFAQKIHDLWGVGNVKCQDGILLFVSKKDKKMYVSTGSGAKEYLTNRGVERVLEAMKSSLRSNDFDGALNIGINVIARELATGRTGNTVGEESSSTEDYLWTAVAWIFCGGILLSFFSKNISRHDEYNQVRRKLERLDRERALARATNFEQTSCPICLEEFATTATTATATDSSSSGTAPAEQSQSSASAAADRAPDLLRCGHKFCRDCIDDWLRRQQTTCPICRQPAIKVGSSERDMRDGPPPSETEVGESKRDGGAGGDAGGDAGASGDADEPSSSSGGASGGEGASGTSGGGDGGTNDAERLDREYKKTAASMPAEEEERSTQSSPSATGEEGGWSRTRTGGGSGFSGSGGFRSRRGWGQHRHGGGYQHTYHQPYGGMEMAFRLASLQRMHPSYVTNDDVQRWSSSSYSGQMSSDTTFIQRNNPTSYARNQGTGSQGFSSSSGGSFGGGSSSGGGGGGGSW